MDSITQAALGAAIGEAVLGKKIGNKAMALGAAVATLPDLDIIFLPLFDQAQRITIHRGYSHSIAGVFLLSLLLAWLFSKWKKLGEASKTRWFVFSFLATFTHILLDAFTTFGTQLYLPFSDYRVAFDSITIIDPLYTLPLLIGVLVGLFYQRASTTRRRLNAAGLIISSIYLGFTLINKQHVNGIMQTALEKQGIEHESFLTIPVSAGNLLWYGVARTEKGLYLGDHSILDENEEIDFEFFPRNEELLADIKDTYLVDRMKWFSDDYYTMAQVDGKLRMYNLKCDMTGFAGENNEAPTMFYFEIETLKDRSLKLRTGMHPKKEHHDPLYRMKRMFGQENKNH
jgi:inner membrane protein